MATNKVKRNPAKLISLIYLIIFFVFIDLFVSAATAAADSKGEIEQKLRDEYVNKNFWIRGFYGGDRLEYDAAGSPAKVGPPLPWTDGVPLVVRG